jgi:hypothetical protein
MTVRRAIIDALIVAALVSAGLQIIIETALENIVSASLVLTSSVTVLLYLRNSRALETQPLSAFSIFGFCVTTQYGALVFQSCAWTPISASLYSPIYTFATLAFYQMIAIGVHAAYRFFSVSPREHGSPFRCIVAWGGIYTRPSTASLWLMGALGLVSFYLQTLNGAPGKIAHGFNFLAWAPFLIPLLIPEAADIRPKRKGDTIALCIYAGIICILGLALNMRFVMMLGGATVGLTHVLNGLRSSARVRPMALARTAGFAMLAVALLGPISDLATAMVIARGARGKIPPAEMIRNTLNAWAHPNLIRAYRADDRAAATYGAYDEYYFDNPVLARFVETKFHDNALHFAGELTTQASQREFRNMTVDSLWAVLPAPLLHVLGRHEQKDEEYSTGDSILYLTRGIPLGGFLTGSVFAQGATLMGPLFPFIYALLCLWFFAWMDLLTTRGPAGTGSLTALAMMNIWPFFIHGISGDGFKYVIASVLRDFPQMILIYCIAFGLTRMTLRFVRPEGASTWRVSGVQSVNTRLLP